MGLQVALGGVRVKRGPTTTRWFYGCPHARRRTEEEAIACFDMGCPACEQFVTRTLKIGVGEKVTRVKEKWGL